MKENDCNANNTNGAEKNESVAISKSFLAGEVPLNGQAKNNPEKEKRC